MRLSEETIAVQVYRSAAIQDLPADFRLDRYVPVEAGPYQRFCRNVVLRPVLPLTTDLSPMRMIQNLLELNDLQILSRAEGLYHLNQLQLNMLDRSSQILFPDNAEWHQRKKCWRFPAIHIAMVGHFLRADFCRLFGKEFIDGLKSPCGAGRIVVDSRKLHRFVEQGRGARRIAPELEFVYLGNNFYRVQVEMRDTMLPYGPASLDVYYKTFCNCLAPCHGALPT